MLLRLWINALDRVIGALIYYSIANEDVMSHGAFEDSVPVLRCHGCVFDQRRQLHRLVDRYVEAAPKR